jgi:mRNA interferase MazF
MNRFDVYLVAIDPALGSRMKNTHPCVIVSPDEINRHIATVIVAPMTTEVRGYPSRVACRYQAKQGQIVLDQLHTVDKVRLVRRLGKITTSVQATVLARLSEMFAE